MEKRDFGNDTLQDDLDEVFKGLDSREIELVIPRLKWYMEHWFRVYQLTTHLRLKYFEAAIQVFFCLKRNEQLGENGFTPDAKDYIMSCIEHIIDKS